MPPVRAAIAPRITREQRATYLSLQGLSELLFFALLLLGLAFGLEKGVPIDAPVLLDMLSSTLWIGIGASVILFAFAGRIRRAVLQDGNQE